MSGSYDAWWMRKLWPTHIIWGFVYKKNTQKWYKIRRNWNPSFKLVQSGPGDRISWSYDIDNGNDDYTQKNMKNSPRICRNKIYKIEVCHILSCRKLRLRKTWTYTHTRFMFYQYIYIYICMENWQEGTFEICLCT